ncbi:TonB-dependent receptor plug domain-containing protein [Pseudoduganella namucuonensis]|uniref:Iron complex outermembrane recepter protein n=1 Tax=Pseudoduganella namucuonensis TaxID=1035707 RepID=A0A1I7IMY2_9BURK|nr:TonB-dependent receptor [Pseudoduganella namucuonensis]SFU74277.1 iron complex outermembrane recepter protein [Pseudoduganella namucuonensis]
MKSTVPRMALSAIAIAVLTFVNTAAAQRNDDNMTRVEVTGSSIRRVATENALPLTTIKAEELVARGLTTMSEVATSLTVGSTNEPVGGGGSGTMINMRGLNTNRTLVLLNGRRLPNEAIGDSSINVDVIPMSAVERVEVLRDGASSIYGTDAIAGVVNFITKRSHTGTTVTGAVVQPERHGGGDQRRVSIVSGWGDLREQGWNVYASLDVQKRSSLLQKDRPNISDPTLIAQLGGNPFSSNTSGSSSSPANFTVYQNGKATTTTGNPYFAAGCKAPYDSQYAIASTKASGAGSKTCILDPDLYPQLLPDNMQATLFSKASLRHGDDKLLTVELLTTESYIDALNPPQIFGAQTDYDKYNPGLRKPLFITKASKYYPGGSGGVPAVAGVTGQDLALTWSMDEVGPAVTDDRQNTHRLAVADQGEFMGWDYKVGLTAAQSKRAVTWKSGFFSTEGIYKGVANGTLNPFGPQDAAGDAYLDSISRDGITYRTARVKYYGPDFNASRPMMELAGGPLVLAVGGDWHKETYRDGTDAVANEVVYKVSGTPGAYPTGSRTVAGLYLEADAPITRQLTLTGAVRADHFSDFGGTVNPKLSVRWQPAQEVMVRGTASTGFRAPTLPELYGTPRTRTPSTGKWDDPLLCPSATPSIPGTGSLSTDPRYAGMDPAKVCNTNLVTLTGANPELQPEKARTLTAGIVLSPVKNMVLSFDVWSINMKGTIAQISEDTIFANLGNYADLFVRNADGTLDYIVKTRLNMGGLRTSGIDTSISYTWPTTGYGKFGVSLDGTYVDSYEGQNEAGGTWVDSVGKPGALATGATSANTYVYRWSTTCAPRGATSSSA